MILNYALEKRQIGSNSNKRVECQGYILVFVQLPTDMGLGFNSAGQK